MKHRRQWAGLGPSTAILGSIVTAPLAARAQFVPSPTAPVTVTADKASGVYGVHDTVHWTVRWKGTGAPEAHYLLKSGGLTEVKKGELSFHDGVAMLESTFTGPNTALVEVDFKPASPQNHVLAGVVAAPERIGPASPEPADFASFWQTKIADLKKIPIDAQLQPDESGKTDVSYWKVSLGNIGGTRVLGQIARPAIGEKFPALLIVQWAGVYGLQKNWVTDRAASGWLALNIEAHDIPIDRPASYYKEQDAGPLHYYWNIGNDDRDTSYYLRMYLSCYRAIEYLRARPDWNGKTLVVTGTSQGGQQTLMIAGLYPDAVTAAIALVPAAGDTLAPTVGRASGFPNWYFNVSGKDPAKVREASRYYDPANFARSIKCPCLIGMGLWDDLAPPSSVLAVANQIKSPKELIILPTSGHQNVGGSQDAFNNLMYGTWLPALRDGKPAPVEATTR